MKNSLFMVCAIFLILTSLLAACTGKTSTTATTQSDMAEMLSYVPYSFLEKQDIWFGDQAKIKQLYGFENINSLESFNQLSAEEQKKLGLTMEGVAGLGMNWREINPLFTGFDIYMIDRTSFDPGIVPPPKTFTIIEGNFDESLIIGKLTALGYQSVSYDSFNYLSINEDYDFGDRLNPIATQVFSAMNRVAVLENTIIAAPATAVLTDILDTMAKTQISMADDPSCQWLLAGLGDAISGVILAPQIVMTAGLPSNIEDVPLFQFEIPQNWGVLHQYDLAGMGFKDDGKEKFWVIALHYQDSQSAASDAGILANRLNSYIFNTSISEDTTKWIPLTDRYEVGQPEVQQDNSGGATISIECRFKPETRSFTWLFPLQGGLPYRDILFLAPDPSLYIAE